jgi:hypothetical protein
MKVVPRYPWYKSAVNVTYTLGRKGESFAETLMITQQTALTSLTG